MLFKEFFIPEWKKMLIYLALVLIFLSEIFLIRFIYREDYMVSFVSYMYYNYFTGLKEYVSLFTMTFLFYILVLFVLYLLSCLIVLIADKIKK